MTDALMMASPAEHTAARLLVVEDSPTQAAEIAFILEDAGFVVDIATDGADGWERIKAQRFDVVISDVLMPKLSGYELCRNIKSDRDTCRLPVVLLTTLNQVTDILRGLECGADAYLNKPCAPEVLVTRVRQCLDAERSRVPSDAGDQVTVRLNGQPFRFPSTSEQVLGYLLPVLGYLASRREDADEREARGHEALRRSEERFALAAAGANDGLWDWDLERQQVYLSPRSNQILGESCQSSVTTVEQWLERMHRDDVDRVQRDLRSHLEGKAPQFESEHRLRGADGSYRWVLLRGCSVRNGNGRPYRMAGSLTDISERMRAQQELLASHEQLQLLSRRLFAVLESERSVVAHELRTRVLQLLAAASAPLSQLSRAIGPGQTAVQRDLRSVVELVNRAMQGLVGVTTQLRSALIGDHGLVTSVRSLVESFTERSGLACELALPPTDLTIDSARSAALFRILQEALTNVGRHAAARRVAVSLLADDRQLVLQIRDDGKGIDCNAAANLSALGLVGMRERARQFGGDVTLSGVPGQGTVLIARMPVNDAGSAAVTPSSSDGPDSPQ